MIYFQSTLSGRRIAQRPSLARRMTIAVVFAAGFMTSVSAQDFLAEPGTPAVAFPKLDCPVANIVSPIWHEEKERDDAGEASQTVILGAVQDETGGRLDRPADKHAHAVGDAAGVGAERRQQAGDRALLGHPIDDDVKVFGCSDDCARCGTAKVDRMPTNA